MKISAIIPAYNSQDFILDAIKSIQNQTHPIDEIIVIDDGSTDNTQQLIQSQTKNIIYLKQDNQGPSAARNAGIKLAKGDWIAFLDADDQWTSDRIEKQLDALSLSPELHLLAGDMQEIDLDNKVITQSVLAKHSLLEPFQINQSRPIHNALAQLVTKNFIPTGTVLVKRSTVLEAGLFNINIRFGEDLELWAKIAAKHPITCLPEILMLRRLHQQNATNATAAMLADLVNVMQSISLYAQDTLSKQNINSNKLVAEAWNNLGYWNFVNHDYQQAKQAFWNALNKKINKRSITYLIACLLPKTLINSIRNLKSS